jgi:flagellin FlaB
MIEVQIRRAAMKRYCVKKEDFQMITNSSKWIRRRLRELWSTQKGVTGLETAIILIAFVVVASVFGYVVLTTGIFATEKGKDATMAGLAQIRTSAMQRGGITTVKSSTADTVDTVKVRISAMSGGASFLKSTLFVSYQDSNQAVIPSFSVVQVQGDDDESIESGELFEVDINLTNLNPPLGANTDFMVVIQPANGSPLLVQRTTSLALDTYNYLD